MAGKEQGIERRILSVPIEKIDQVENARITYGSEDLSELMVSMRFRGLLSPIGVQPHKGDRFEVVFGNRRLTAARKLGWTHIDAVLATTKDRQEMLIVNAVENMQRVDVPFAEQGRIFFALEKQGLSRKEIAARIGISHAKVTSIMNTYGKIPERFRPLVAKGQPGARIRGGKLPATTASLAVGLSSRYKLKKNDLEKVMTYAQKDGVTGVHIHRIAGLVKAGESLSSAIKMVDKTRIVTVALAIPAEKIKSLESEHKQPIHDIIYSTLRKERWLGVVHGRSVSK